MKKQFFLGALIGVITVLIFQKIKKKPCGCQETIEKEIADVPMGANMGSSKEESLMAEPTTCEEAADMVAKQRLSVMKFASKEGYNQAYQTYYSQELTKCQNS